MTIGKEEHASSAVSHTMLRKSRKSNAVFLLLLAASVLAVAMGIISPSLPANDSVNAKKLQTQAKEMLASAPSRSCDERLTLLYVLDRLYNSFPGGNDTSENLEKKMADFRSRVLHYQAYVKQKNFDENLSALFDDCLQATDSYVDYLADIGKIDRETIDRAESEGSKAGFTAGVAGGTVAATMYDNGYSGGDAALAGIVVGIGSLLYDCYNSSCEIDNVKQEAIDAALNKLNQKISAIFARRKVLEAELAARYGWPETATSQTISVAEYERMADLMRRNDFSSLSEFLNRKREQRPHDPFLAVLRSCCLCADFSCSVRDMNELAMNAYFCVAALPDNSVYNVEREKMLYSIADLTQSAWFIELSGKTMAGAGSQTAALAVELWDKVLEYSNDVSGDCRERRAWALMACGRLKEAEAQADAVRDLRCGTLRYALNYARLMNAEKRAQLSFDWFEYAVKTLSFNDICYAKTDPDLAYMREECKDAFEKLTTATATWNVKFGIFNDDIVMTNTSAFSLTNVTLEYVIEGGEKKWSGTLTAKEIPVGKMHKWSNVVSIPNSKIDRRDATFSCDQDQ